MTIARNHQIFLNEPTYFHLISRCVRRAYLCGKDKHSGKRYDHRKRWLKKRLFELSELFFIDLYGYAIMSNHYHLVIKTRPDESHVASNQQIAQRWCRVFSCQSNRRDARQKDLCDDIEKINLYRKRLCDISWFMRCLNEALARMANKEDNCSGRFWQGRFRSQLLLDDSAVYTCMVYVDLNPVRAGIALSPPEYKFTSVSHRIIHQKINEKIKPLNESREYLDLQLSDYLNLVNETAMCVQKKKPENVFRNASPILARLNIKIPGYINAMQSLTGQFYRAIGRVDQLEQLSALLNLKWVRGRRMSLRLFY